MMLEHALEHVLLAGAGRDKGCSMRVIEPASQSRCAIAPTHTGSVSVMRVGGGFGESSSHATQRRSSLSNGWPGKSELWRQHEDSAVV